MKKLSSIILITIFIGACSTVNVNSVTSPGRQDDPYNKILIEVNSAPALRPTEEAKIIDQIDNTTETILVAGAEVFSPLKSFSASQTKRMLKKGKFDAILSYGLINPSQASRNRAVPIISTSSGTVSSFVLQPSSVTVWEHIVVLYDLKSESVVWMASAYGEARDVEKIRKALTCRARRELKSDKFIE